MSRRLINGIHSQSNEILGQIFLEHVEWAMEDILHTTDGPWVLSHVCRSWKKITLAHPEVWSFIHVEEPESRTGPETIFLLNLALVRSQHQPLDIKLGFAERHYTALHMKIIRAVVAQSDRWKTADLQITNALAPSFAPIRNRLSKLTKLKLTNFTDDSPEAFPYAMNAPCLTDIALNNYPHDIVALPWSSIRHFASDMTPFPDVVMGGVVLLEGGTVSIDAETYVSLLRNNPQLESLDLTYPSPSPPTSTLTHLSLRRLCGADGRLIRALTLPNLEELIITLKDDTISAVRGLLARSKCSLRSLRLIDFTLSTDVLAILSQSASLQTLIIIPPAWDTHADSNMKRLVRTLAQPSFLPCLEDLEIQVHEDRDEREDLDAPVEPLRPQAVGFVDDALVEMLAARWERRRTAEGRAYLQKVCVLIELPSTVGLSRTRGIGGLRKMSDEGLDVVINARDPRDLNRWGPGRIMSYVYNV
ncbi:hypothetical protein GGX14DRAFT_428255 [Mycena pura]|uniref:F-box domain-containing protein n=1 Tax=Mycena pura TaxID=153505 RepID=A0AAD6YHP3_9AGAR|nr:hypothetical protein GGX14DRAFT_428255 [Mycena pura]